MSDFAQGKRARLLSELSQLLQSSAEPSQNRDNMPSTSFRSGTMSTGSGLRERMNRFRDRKQGEGPVSASHEPRHEREQTENSERRETETERTARQADSAKGQPTNRLLSAEELTWNRRLRSVGFDSVPLAASSTDAGAPGVDIDTPASPLTLMRKTAVKRQLQDREVDGDSDDLFASPENPQRAPEKIPKHTSARRVQQRPSAPARAKEAGEGQDADDIQDKEDTAAEPASNLPIPSALPIAAAEFRACPDSATAVYGGSEQPLELQAAPGNHYPDLCLSVPGSINAYLREYQKQGVRFLFRQYSQGIGGILADDMGLGKTVQTIAFCAALLGKTGTEEDAIPRPAVAGRRRSPILIIAPSSVLDNWSREFQTWGSFNTCMFSEKMKASAMEGTLAGKHEVMLVSFDTYRRSHEDLHQLSWHVIIVDEVHKLKNDESKTYKAAAQVGTKLRYGLTGTVMQNSYDELWNILDYVVPNCLGGRTEFMDFYARPLKRARQVSASPYVLSQGQKRQKKLHQTLQKYLLRRRKDNTIKDQMPNKVDNIVFCELSELQLRAYRRTLDSPDFRHLLASLDPCSCGSGAPAGHCCDTEYNVREGVLWQHFHMCDCDCPYDAVDRPNGCKRHKPEGCLGRLRCPLCLILPALTILRKISNHLELIKADPEDCSNDPRKMGRQEEVALMVLGEDAAELGGAHAQKNFLGLSDVRSCGKLLALEKLLELWSQPGMDNKVLVFSHSVKMLNMLEANVVRNGHSYTRLDGSTSREDRQKMVDQFNRNASLFLFLISTLAGGVGLNLASANKVVVMDPSWNPASDLQAIDRAYRLGQKRDVNVFRLITTGTLEEVIYSRQLYKQQQSNVAIENAQERRYFEAVQKERKGSGMEVKGELFGIQNLLRFSAERLRILELVHAQRRTEADFRIEQYNPEELAEADGEAEAGSAAFEERAEDGGLDNLAEQLARAAVARLDAPSQANPGQEAAVLMEAGVVETLKHDQLLGTSAARGKQPGRAKALPELKTEEASIAAENLKSGTGGQRTAAAKQSSKVKEGCAAGSSEAPKQKTQRAEKTPWELGATKNAATRSDGGGRSMGPLSSLACWQCLSVNAMAERLLAMTESERTNLRHMYATSMQDPISGAS